jgi:hypothetical protein
MDAIRVSATQKFRTFTKRKVMLYLKSPEEESRTGQGLQQHKRVHDASVQFS